MESRKISTMILVFCFGAGLAQAATKEPIDISSFANSTWCNGAITNCVQDPLRPRPARPGNQFVGDPGAISSAARRAVEIVRSVEHQEFRGSIRLCH